MSIKKVIHPFLVLSIFISGCTEKEIVEVGFKGTMIGFVSAYNRGNGVSKAAGATVVLEGSDPLITTTTDSNGRFLIEDLPTGTYDVVVSKEGYGTYKSVSYSFLGGGQSTPWYGGIWILPKNKITDVSGTFSPSPSWSPYTSFRFVLKSGPDGSYTGTDVCYFIGTSNTVSSTSYSDAGYFSAYFGSPSYSYTIPFSKEKYPPGTTAYIIFYPSTTASFGTYVDRNTGRPVYPSMSLEGSSVITLNFP